MPLLSVLTALGCDPEGFDADDAPPSWEPAPWSCPGGALVGYATFRTQADVDSFPADCWYVRGPINIYGEDIYDISNLSSIDEATSLTVWGAEDLRSLAPLTGLKFERVNVWESGVEDLQGLENVATVARLHLRDTPRLETLSGLGIEAAAEIIIDGAVSLRSLEGLETLRDVDSITIRDVPALTDASGLAGLETLGDRVTIENAPQLAELEVFANLDRGRRDAPPIGLYLSDVGVTSLTSLSQYPIGALSLVRTDLSTPAGLDRFSNLQLLEISENSALEGFPVPAPGSASTVYIDANSSLTDAQAWAYVETIDDVERAAKVARNGGASAPNPCPWVNDGSCDEPRFCAAGTDGDDCWTPEGG